MPHSDDLADLLCALARLVRHPHRAVALRWTFVFDNRTTLTVVPQGEIMVLLTDTQKVTASIQPMDAKGYPARVDGVPTWITSDALVADVQPSADGLSCVVVAGLPGIAQISVTADADLGAGVRAISGTLDIQVEPGEAVSLAVTAGVPEQQ